MDVTFWMTALRMEGTVASTVGLRSAMSPKRVSVGSPEGKPTHEPRRMYRKKMYRV